MDLKNIGAKNPLCKFSWSYDNCYHIEFHGPYSLTPLQTYPPTHPQTTPRVSVETYRPRGETIGFKKLKLQYPTVTTPLHAEIDEKITISYEVKKFSK